MADAINGATKVVLFAYDTTTGQVERVSSDKTTGLKVSLGTLLSGENTRHNVIQVANYGSYEHISSTSGGTIAAVTCGVTGSAGDILQRIVVCHPGPGSTTLRISGSGSEAIPILPAQAGTGTYVLEIGAVSTSAGWRITPATGQDVLAIGHFT